MRIGIDVGGTNTDAVLMDGREVVAWAKELTTPDVTTGILQVLRALLGTSPVNVRQIQAVMIGTTHFTNALTEGKHLTPTAIIRVAPTPQTLPPMVDWPDRLRRLLGGHVYLCQGGHEYDGRPIFPLDRARVREVAADIRAKGIHSVAVSSVFSPVNQEFEQEVAGILTAENPDAAISLSHEIGRIGLLERENATIINASLRDLADRIVDGFRDALAASGIEAPVYLSQNDGTLMSVEYAKRYPVKTFASGPTNSMRGAAFLSRIPNCAVVDVGGTTSDVGILQNGFPRPASVAVELSGVRTNFRMPDVYSFGLGGGSIVRTKDGLSVGPDSVGYRLNPEALVFGGETLTATDIAVAAGLAEIGDPSYVASLDSQLVRSALDLMENLVTAAIDRMKTSAQDIRVVVVGGGSILVGDRLPGATEIVRPPHFSVANAIGAAIAQVGGEVDRVFSLDKLSRDETLEEATREAVEKAVAAGAQQETIQIVDMEDVPLTHLPSGTASRVRVKAVGELDMRRTPNAVG